MNSVSPKRILISTHVRRQPLIFFGHPPWKPITLPPTSHVDWTLGGHTLRLEVTYYMGLVSVSRRQERRLWVFHY